MVGLFALEFPFTVAALALFGIAAPDTYRTILWNEGGLHGWNSNPSEVLYAAANYRKLTIPMVWTQLCVRCGRAGRRLPVLIWRGTV